MTTTTTADRRKEARPVVAAGRSQLQAQRVRAAMLFLLPMLAALALVAAWPLFRTIWFSFTDARLDNLSDYAFIGFDNYLANYDGEWLGLLTDPALFPALWCAVMVAVTLALYYAGGFTYATLTVPMMAALLCRQVDLGRPLERVLVWGAILLIVVNNLDQVRQFREALAAVTAPPNHHAWVALPAYVLTEIADAVRRRRGMALPAGLPRWAQWSAVTCLAGAFVFMALLFLARKTATNPFVYANF